MRVCAFKNVRVCKEDTADSVGMCEGDPRLLLLPVSLPDIDPSCPTQIGLKETGIHCHLDISNMALCKLYVHTVSLISY